MYMSIKDSFIPYDELLELFGVQRVNALFRCLKQNNISFILDKRNKPLVLRSALEGTASDQPEQEETVVFT
jgi:hypothetical protein